MKKHYLKILTETFDLIEQGLVTALFAEKNRQISKGDYIEVTEHVPYLKDELNRKLYLYVSHVTKDISNVMDISVCLLFIVRISSIKFQSV